MLAASVILGAAQPVMAAESAPPPSPSPWGLYFQGKSLEAREALVRRLQDPSPQDPAARLSTLETLLDICIHSYADDCILEYAPKYIAAVKAAPAANEILRREQARKVGYYIDYGRYVFGAPEITAKILDGERWRQENSLNADLYIRRQILASNIQLQLGDTAGATRSADKILSLTAALKNPQEDRHLIAWALSDVIATLLATGDVERAYGIYRASDGLIADALPVLSVDAAAYRVTQAQLLQERGDLRRAELAAKAAVATLQAIEMDDGVRERLMGEALLVQAAACAGSLQLDCAREAIRLHPFAALYAQPGRTPSSPEEVAYLAARALVMAFSQQNDPVAAEALSSPLGFTPSAGSADMVEVHRLAGAALAQPPGQARQEGLFAAGRRIALAASRAPSGALGAWYRPGAVDHLLIALALTQADRSEPGADETVFALMQLAGRRGVSVDADALTALGQAKDTLQRRSVHQALRLRARRDRFERAELQKVAAQAAAQASAGGLMSYDFDTRRVFRDFAGRIAAADEELSNDGVATSGANVVPLARFQALLQPDEAALTVSPVPGGMAYMCVRRNRTLRRVAQADLKHMAFDIRILQAALTAGHAPSEMLDAQFPVAAAMRLYDVLIRPFDGCLKPGDRILWLPNASITPLPLSILLEHAPPKLGGGYDLAAADWLVRRHAVSYAGSAAMVVAARSGGAPPTADFDFLGVGDPVLSGKTEAGEDRGEILMRGVRGGSALSVLAPLPETRIELEQSARGFRSARVLTGAEATERGVRGQLVGSYRYLSFATHGLLRDEIEGLSEPALALTPVASSDATNDGLLTAEEIADLNLAARFVALSACNTANFDMTQMAADLPALASAFAVAGVPSILATLWSVESQTGQQVVAAAFANLRAGKDPASALAEAQRAFLAAPPGRAYLHPRFWAPFLVLGDGAGAAPAATPTGLTGVTSVDVLTHGGDIAEVIALERMGRQVFARYIGPLDADGWRISGVWASSDKGAEAWRHESHVIGANRVLLQLGDHVAAGGYMRGPQDRFIPTLEAFDPTKGKPAGTWLGDIPPGLDGFMAGGVGVGAGKAFLAVAGLNIRGEAAGPNLALYEVGEDLAPRKLFEIERPSGLTLDEATITPVGGDLLITYTELYPPPKRPSRLIEDDFQDALCLGEPTTWVELRDAASGTLKAKTELPGWTVAAALKRDGKILLGGAVRTDCTQELRAAVLALGEDLSTRTLYRDESLGNSEVRSLAALADGTVLAAGRKENVLDVKPLGPGGGGVRPWADRGLSYSGMLLTLRGDGRTSAPKMLDAGSDVFVTSAEASDPNDILVGGSLGGEAAIFHLSERRIGRAH